MESADLTERLRAEEERKRESNPVSAVQALRSGRVWHLAATYLALMTGFYSMSFWMPQTVKALSSHYSNTTVGLLVMIPHLVGLAAMLTVSWSSDRRMERKWHTALPVMAGFTVTTTITSPYAPAFCPGACKLVSIAVAKGANILAISSLMLVNY